MRQQDKWTIKNMQEDQQGENWNRNKKEWNEKLREVRIN